MTALRTQLEDAVIEAVTVALPYLADVAPYNGEFSKSDLSEVYAVLAGSVPAVLVTTGDGKAATSDIQRRYALKHVNVDLYLVSGNMRSETEKLRGENEIYQIAEDLERLLMGRDVGIDGIGVLSLVNESIVFVARDLAIWRVRYSVPVESAATELDAEDLTLTEIIGRAKLPLAEDTVIASGTGDSLARTDTTMRLTDAGASFIAGYVGRDILIAGAHSKNNNGRFMVTAVVDGTTLEFTNPDGVTEAFAGSWQLVTGTLVTVREQLTA